MLEEKWTEAQQEVSKISDEQAVVARNNIPNRGEDTKVGTSESSEADVLRVLSNSDDGILQKLGIRKPGGKEETEDHRHQRKQRTRWKSSMNL